MKAGWIAYIAFIFACFLIMVSSIISYNDGQKDALFDEQKYILDVRYKYVIETITVYKTDTVYDVFFPVMKENCTVKLRMDTSYITRSAYIVNDDYWVYDYGTNICTHTYVVGTKEEKKLVPADTLIINKKSKKIRRR